MTKVVNPKLTSLIPDDDCVLNKTVGTLNWGVIKFIAPENVVQQKQIYDLNHFLHHCVNQKLNDITTLICQELVNDFQKKLDEISDKVPGDKRNELLDQTVTQLKEQMSFDTIYYYNSTRVMRDYRFEPEQLNDMFEAYKLNHSKELETGFSLDVTKQTCLRGLKFSGAFETLEEARARAKHVNVNIEPNIDAYVVPLGQWIPLDTTPDAVQDQEYNLEQLNSLMSKYNENVRDRNEFFEKRKQTMMSEARKANNQTLKANIRGSAPPP